MNIIKLFGFNCCFLILPITLYILFIEFINISNKKRNIYLNIILFFTSFSLLSIYSQMKIEFYLIILSIPILISFHFNKTVISIIISLMTILFFFEKIDINLIYLIILFIFNYLPYLIYRKNNNRLLLSILFTINNLLYFIIMCNYSLHKTLTICVLYVLTIYLYTYIISNVKYVFNNNKKTLLKIIHEIKNPLFVLKGYLSFDNKDINDYKEILKIETENALKILEDLRDMNHLKTNKSLFKINTLLKEINQIILPLTINKNITYTYKCNNNISIYADYNRLKQVFINILKNSLEELDNNGKINLTCSKKDNNLFIKIKDNGPGMTQEQINNLFTPFNTHKDYGTGLGLCLSKEIIDIHNGKLYYTSIKNKNTIANILLPINNNMDSNSLA